ncbi:hypothetical protein PIB30_060035 [Stylosanthes scabra]|uniref:Uncharacterized protein n=1 Tax=Stylosanthes scabra TaxID=79078 RepID=A0ABU6TK67_9FABA|nr:hypothetical protein [Stylosanthes scabra]
MTFLFFTMVLYSSSLKADWKRWLSQTETDDDDAIDENLNWGRRIPRLGVELMVGRGLVRKVVDDGTPRHGRDA